MLLPYKEIIPRHIWKGKCSTALPKNGELNLRTLQHDGQLYNI